MALQVIVGKGSIGATVAELLVEQGQRVRLISRSGGPGTGGPGDAEQGGDGRIEYVALDATDPDALTAATTGADVLYNCAGPAYHRWPTDWPPLLNAMLTTAERTGAVLVNAGNLYGYGPVEGPMTEDLPLVATGRKGAVRAALWREALSWHEAGRIRTTEARASNYYGAGVTFAGEFGERMVPKLLRGQTVRVLGDPDAPHAWTYVPDFARALVRLGSDERAWGRVWHVPTAPPFSQREAVGRMCAIAGVKPARVARQPWWLVNALGTVVPLLGELAEVRYQFDRPFLLDSSRYTALFGEHATDPAEGLAHTVRWWQQKLASGSTTAVVGT